jgi:archaellum component FlaC
MADLEDALKKLDRLTQEEARMAHAEVLRITHSIRDEVKIVDGKVERVEDKVEDVGEKVEGVGEKVEGVGEKVEGVGEKVEGVGEKVEGVGEKVDEVGDKVGEKVQCVDEKVQVVINGARGLSSHLKTILTSILSDGKQARVAATEAKLIIQQTANGIDEIKCSCLPTNLAFAYCLRLNLLTGNQWKQLLRTWLSPVDPSTNHNIARKAHHMGTAVWLFQGQIVIEWRSAGSLLWIHGKRGFLLLFSTSDF